jgi:membrane fusion protein (multidrug efflux system)
LLAIAVAAASGCDQEGQGGFSPPPMPVEIAVAAEQPVSDRFEAVGTIEAGEAITVVAEIDAAVVRLPFEEGKEIAKGKLIAQLDDTQRRAEVERTEAIRDQAKITYGRVKSIVEKGAGSQQDLDNAAAVLKVAEADFSLARARLAKTRIVAPFDGVVGARRVSPGAFLQPGDPITDLAQLRKIKVTFSAPERYLSQLRPGATVSVSTPAYPSLQLEGKIDVVDPVLDPTTRSAKVIARVDNPESKLRPGMSTNVSALLSQRLHAVTIPSEAVFAEGNQSLVFVVGADSTVSRRPLVLGTRFPDVVEVTEGLSPGMQVVRAGHQKLFDGAKVIPIASQAEAGAGAGADTSQAGSDTSRAAAP